MMYFVDEYMSIYVGAVSGINISVSDFYYVEIALQGCMFTVSVDSIKEAKQIMKDLLDAREATRCNYPIDAAIQERSKERCGLY